MIYFTQLIYINEGQEAVFDEFEDVAMPLIEKYNGKLLLRVRPTTATILERQMDQPYEIHLVEFPEEKDFVDFSRDEERKKFLHLKEKSVKAVMLIKGEKI
jgi:uncharacterized protein (DUF1330 family)